MAEELAPDRRRQIERALDRMEDRIRDAPRGLHATGRPAEAAALHDADLPADAAPLWERFDGIDLAHGEVHVLALAQQTAATRMADADGRLQPGDRVIAERGRDVYVLPDDPWAEGADVVLVSEAGDRSPEASSVAHLVLGLIGELSVLYGNDGEFREEMFGDDGELEPQIERRLLRRRLDLDEDAPHPRYLLARLLRRAGEARAARTELQRVLRCAPTFAWAHHELGRALLDLQETSGARDAGLAAAEHAADPQLGAYFLAWAAMASSGDERRRIVAQALKLDPGFVATRVAGIRTLIDRGAFAAARELLDLALCVAPGHLELLALRPAVSSES